MNAAGKLDWKRQRGHLKQSWSPWRQRQAGRPAGGRGVVSGVPDSPSECSEVWAWWSGNGTSMPYVDDTEMCLAHSADMNRRAGGDRSLVSRSAAKQLAECLLRKSEVHRRPEKLRKTTGEDDVQGPEQQAGRSYVNTRGV